MPKTIKKKVRKKDVDVSDIEEIQSIFSKVFEERRKAVLYAVGLIAMIGIIGVGLTIYSTKQAEKALFLEGQAVESFYAAASASDEEEGYAKALELFQQANNIKKSETSLFYIAESYLKMGEQDKAIETYRKFINDYGRSTLASAVRAKIANIRMKNKDYTGALAEIENIKDDIIWSDTALIDIADIYDRMGKADEAKQALNELTTSFPDSPWVLEAKNRIGEEKEASESTSDETTNSAEPQSNSAEPEPISN